MTALAIVVVTCLVFVGATIGFLTATLMASGSREDACRECPDRRFAQAVDEWRDGTDDD